MIAEAYHKDKLLSKGRIYLSDKSAHPLAMADVNTADQIRLVNVRILINEAGSPTQAARQLEMDTSQLSQIAGRNPTRNIGPVMARRIERAFSKPKGWLDVFHAVQDRALYDLDGGPELRSEVPLISWVQAGNWREVVDNLQAGAAERWIPTTERVGKHSYALRVIGDSMFNPRGAPSFPEGTIIIVDPDRSAAPGRYVVVRQGSDGECTFKQLTRDAGRFYLKPLNPQYQLLEMSTDATICGVLVQAVTEF